MSVQSCSLPGAGGGFPLYLLGSDDGERLGLGTRLSLQPGAARRCGQGDYLLKIRAVLLTLSWGWWEKQTALYPGRGGPGP